jgi:hypothetical protein
MEKNIHYYAKAKKAGKKTISYSQLSMYTDCPKNWELQYKQKLKKWEPTIFGVFGTAIHECIQEFLTVMYSSTAKLAEALPLANMLKTNMYNLYEKEVAKTGKHFSTADDLKSMYYEGTDILDYLVKHRSKYFNRKDTELVGIEMPIFIESEANSNIMILSFLDVVLKVNDRIKILDLKTSTWGWGKGEKKKNGDQLRLYKKYFAKQYEIPESEIDVEYLIMKRKLYEDMDFAQKRFQVFKPAAGKPSINKLEKKVSGFINNVYNMDGSFKEDASFPATPGLKNCNCKWCPFAKNYEVCPKENRIRP